MECEQDELLKEFTSFLSLELGIYMGRGLFENYPNNFNEQMPQLAGELLAKVKLHDEQKRVRYTRVVGRSRTRGGERISVDKGMGKIIPKQQKLDRPDREKIKEVLYCVGCPHSLLDFECDKILSFIPDIEEALRQRDEQWKEEIKRMFDRGYQKCFEDNQGFAEEAKREERERIIERLTKWSKTGEHIISTQAIQALKEEK